MQFLVWQVSPQDLVHSNERLHADQFGSRPVGVKSRPIRSGAGADLGGDLAVGRDGGVDRTTARHAGRERIPRVA